MSDRFESKTEFAARGFETMARADWHACQVLTKRPERMARFAGMFRRHFGYAIPGHVWMGVSVEDDRAASRIGASGRRGAARGW